MKIENVNIDTLKPLKVNARKHSDKQIVEFAKSIKQFGQFRPFVVDEEGNILVGNGMYEAMKREGYTQCDVYRVTGLTETQKKKLILTDNKIYALGQDDFDGIESLISDICKDGDFDIPGYDDDTLRALTRTAEEAIEDVMSYGKVEEIAQPSKAVEASQRPTPEPMPKATPEAVNAAETQPQYAQPAESVRTIVCPCCGEVIRIS